MGSDRARRQLIATAVATVVGLAMLGGCGSGMADDGDGVGGTDGGDTGGGSSVGGGASSGGDTATGTGGLGGDNGTGGAGTGGQETVWPPAQRIALTAAGGCALGADNRVLCWGGSTIEPWDYPEVFATNLSTSLTRVVVTQLDGRGGWFASPTTDVAPEPVLEPFAGDRTFVKVGASTYAGAGLAASGALTLELFGGSDPSEVGPDDPLVDVHGDFFFCGVKKVDGALTCWQSIDSTFDEPCADNFDHGQLSPPSGAFSQVAAGGTHFCALRADRTVACWGAGDGDTPECEASPVHWGQTGAPDGEFQHVCAGTVHSCAVRMDGTIACWGAGTVDGECGDDWDCGMAAPPPDDDFVQVGCGYTHSCGLKESGKVVCWGSDSLGRSTPPPELTP